MSIRFKNEDSRERVSIYTSKPTPFSGVVSFRNNDPKMWVSWEERFTVVENDGLEIRGSRDVTVFMKRGQAEALRDRLTEMLDEFDAATTIPPIVRHIPRDPSDPNGDGHGVY